jgi:hypothetical protein
MYQARSRQTLGRLWIARRITLKPKKKSRFAMQRTDVSAVMAEIVATIADWHNRESSPGVLPDRTPPHLIRYTPSFQAGKAPIDSRAVAYTVLSLGQYLGDVDSSRKRNPRAGKAVSVALSLLALQEMGDIDPAAAERMASGLSLNSLEDLTAGLSRRVQRTKRRKTT